MSPPLRHTRWTRDASPGSASVPIASEIPATPSPRKTNIKTVEQSFLSACKKHRNVIIVSVISHVIFIIFILIVCLLYYKGTSAPSNHEKDAIEFPSVSCPPDWIGHLGHCYKVSGEEKNWKESQNFCISHNASLAKITKEELDFVMMLKRNRVFWIGLRREPGQPWMWPDGEKATLEVKGEGGDCAFLNDDATASSARCSTECIYTLFRRKYDFPRK